MMTVSLHFACKVNVCTNDIVVSAIYSHNVFTAAVVGLERTFYQVSEDVGVVNVCAIVYSPAVACPIEFFFEVNLIITNGSAGKERVITRVSCNLVKNYIQNLSWIMVVYPASWH